MCVHAIVSRFIFDVYSLQVESSKDVARSEEGPCSTEEGGLPQATCCTGRLNGTLFAYRKN